MMPAEAWTFRVEPNANRILFNRLRFAINPIIGVVCGLVFGAALFLIAVQGLFRVTPSLIAVIILILAVLAYLSQFFRERHDSRQLGAYQVSLDERGAAVLTRQGTRTYGWERFARWTETDTEFMLVSRQLGIATIVVVLPLVAVPEDALDDVRDLLHTHIDPDAESLDGAFVEDAEEVP